MKKSEISRLSSHSRYLQELALKYYEVMTYSSVLVAFTEKLQKTAISPNFKAVCC